MHAETHSLSNLAKQDFFAVLSNGFDTMLTLSKHLNFTGHLVLDVTPSVNGYCPWRHSAIAAWTAGGTGRIAIVLNRLGEILIFRDGQLLFARRSGNWHFLTHGPIIRQMGVPKDEDIRKAVYETALDASFARTGACIGVIAAGSMKLAEDMIAQEDLLSKSLSDKSKAIARIVNGKGVYPLDASLTRKNYFSELILLDANTLRRGRAHIFDTKEAPRPFDVGFRLQGQPKSVLP